MNSILEKISSYNIFSNMVPGGIYMYISDLFIGTKFFMNNVYIMLLLSYFIGIIIGRTGSIFVEKILLKFSKQKEEEYSKYIKMCNKDKKIEILLQDRNMYRNICTMSLLLILTKIYFGIKEILKVNNSLMFIIICLLLVILFSMAFIKQNNIIIRRIKADDND